VTSSLPTFEAAIRVKSTHLIKSCFQNRKKERKYGNKRNFYINYHLKVCLDIEFTAYEGELMPEEGIVIEVR